MTVEEAVRARIMSLATVTALVSTRVYTLKLPQSPTLPAVRLQLIDETDVYSHEGYGQLSRARVQVDAIAQEGSGTDPYAVANQIATAIQGNGRRQGCTGLAGFKGGIGSPEFHITGIVRDLRRTMYDAEELRQVKVIQDYIVWYRVE